MKPYAELLEFNQPSPIRKEGFTKIRDQYTGLKQKQYISIDWEHADDYADFVYCDPERIVEFAGRSDYGPKNAAKLGSDKSIIARWIDSGHHSMLEMAEATFYIECSRAVSHELVRHRLCNFQQESQRFVKYDEASEESFYIPDGEFGPDIEAQAGHALNVYKNLREKGVPAQIARYVLPNAMGTRLIMKANVREWRHIVNLRTAKAAQPEMRELMLQVYDQLVDVFPNLMTGALNEEAVR